LTIFMSTKINVCRASHIHFGTISWKRLNPTVLTGTTEIQFKATLILDYNYYKFQLKYKRLPQKDDWIDLSQNEDSTIGIFTLKSSNETIVIPANPFVVKNFFEAKNFLIGQYEDTVDLKDVSNEGPWTVSFKDCCRLSSLKEKNGNSRDLILKAQITFTGREHGIIATGSSREYFEINKQISYYIPVLMPQNLKAKFEFTPSSDSGLKYTIPGTMSTPIELNTSTGQMTWIPALIGLYAVSIRISEDCNPGSILYSKPPTGCKNGETPDYTTVDFLIEVLSNCKSHNIGTSCAPYFVPEKPDDQYFFRDERNHFTLVAEDADPNDWPKITWSILPLGAECHNVSTSIRLTSRSINASVSTISCSWKPLWNSSNTNICFKAFDEKEIPSFNNYCMQWIIKNPTIIFVPGTINDFSNNMPDFNHKSNLDIGLSFVSTQLGNDRKPVFKSNSHLKSVANASTFNHWLPVFNH